MWYWSKLLNPIQKPEKYAIEQAKYDMRSPFKRDFDRICNSSILRRLQDKAQVFPLEEGDYARTRLTHSIEVLSIAESLGISLRNEIRRPENTGLIMEPGCKMSEEKIQEWIQDIPVILMSAALLHDMGNPPFGHMSEQIISKWFEEHLEGIEYNKKKKIYEPTIQEKNSIATDLKGQRLADLLHFDGNAQLLRLVSRLTMIVDMEGMHLTYPLMAAFIKYPTDSEHINTNDKIRKKAGYFYSETEIFEDIEQKLGLKVGDKYYRHPLAFLLEAADDIAYLTADIEDAHHKGLIELKDIDNYLEVYGGKTELIEKIRRMLNDFKNEAIKRDVPNKEDYVMHRLRILIKGEMINAVSEALHREYNNIMYGRCTQELLMMSAAKDIVNAFKRIEKEKVYYCREITESKIRATTIIRKLLDTYVPAALNYKKEIDEGEDTENNFIYESFSSNYRFLCKESCKGASQEDIVYNKLRLVIDQIVGMTDSRALKEYHTIVAG